MKWNSASYVIDQVFSRTDALNNYVNAKNLDCIMKQLEQSNENDLFLIKNSHNASFLTCLLKL